MSSLPWLSHPFPQSYQPELFEAPIYEWWNQEGHFSAKDHSKAHSKAPSYCIILPPPNVTGILHLGHALNASLQDCMIRWKRMCGYNALWLPGTDHAGIATQSVVEKHLKISAKQLGREKFVQKVWEWKKKYGNHIIQQMHQLGASCDWNRHCFTLDPHVSKAVRHVFVALYKKGLIYRGETLVNWSPKLQTAISDLEVEHREVKGKLWHIKYLLTEARKDKKHPSLIIATTRPETLLADTALCVHPEDERYQSYIGKKAQVPLCGRSIPIIADKYVDPKFGSGVLKITPAHDFNDYQLGKKHALPILNILNPNGSLNKEAGPYKDLSTYKARELIVEDLKSQNLLEKVEDHTHSVGHCSRTQVVVEPYLSKQWFVRTKELAKKATQVVEEEALTILPKAWKKTYIHWMHIIEDWCISRQIEWGHPIPAWHCQDCQHIQVPSIEDIASNQWDKCNPCDQCGSKKMQADKDVLDTWFSSALWPFVTLGWPHHTSDGSTQETEAEKCFYPTSLLITGHDILFFWVARMAMMAMEFKQKIPFHQVYLHGLVRDEQGRKNV